MPLDLDFLTEIGNVHWGGGGIFTAGVNVPTGPFNTTLTLLRCEMPNPDSTVDWQTTGNFSGIDQLYDIRGGAYGCPGKDKDTGKNGKPIFVIGGQQVDYTVHGPQAFNYKAFIIRSTDGGRSWSRTYTTAIGFGSFITAMAYNEKDQAFYADRVDTSLAGESVTTAVSLRSLDGISWSEGGSIVHTGANPTPAMNDACDPVYKEGAGYNCPGGIYGYNKEKGIIIAPYPDVQAYVYSQKQAREQIQLRTVDASGASSRLVEVKSISEFGSIYSVAYEGDIWQIAGIDTNDNPSALFACSTDDGKTWKIVHRISPVSIAVTMLAAPITDFSADSLKR